MDRSWWSTIAYGWYGTDLSESIDLETFLKVAQLPAEGLLPNVVFVFLDPWTTDPHNSAAVRRGYEELSRLFSDRAVRVAPAPADDVTTFILNELQRRGLVTTQ